ncbi:MAG: RHS repeat-associated core domain-containing protein [Chitinophagales bacterium]|nr:hypothetical protein [Bacteroidota bacterium]MBK8683158.1 hypothetical protein [Bacteroidota bacterium]
MLIPGRQWSAGSEYRFGFNGKESDAETYGEGNAYDFGARIYDARLGRWMSVDPLQRKYPNLSPYSGFGNNPVLIVDVDGRENFIYVVFLPSSEGQLTTTQKEQIIYQTQVFLTQALNLNVQVVEYDQTKHGEFDGKYLDMSDAVVAIGSANDVSKFAERNVANSENSDLWDANWGSYNSPEISESVGQGHSSSNPKFGQVVGISSDALVDKRNSVGEESTANPVVTAGVYLISHGLGHNVGYSDVMDVTIPINPNDLNSLNSRNVDIPNSYSIMVSGPRLMGNNYSTPGLINRSIEGYDSAEDWMNSGYTKDLRPRYREKFSGFEPTDNYDKNKSVSQD